MDDLSKTNKKDPCMDKYNSKTSFQEWDSIDFKDLPQEIQNKITKFNAYSEKLIFQMILHIRL
jgi:hypothetical protein